MSYKNLVLFQDNILIPSFLYVIIMYMWREVHASHLWEL